MFGRVASYYVSGNTGQQVTTPPVTTLTPSTLMTSQMKKALVERWTVGGQSVKEVAQASGVKVATIHKWTERVRANRFLRSCGGRPSLLDRESVFELNGWKIVHPGFSRQDIKDQIIYQYGLSCQRQHPGVVKELSKRSLQDQIKKFT